MKHAFSSCMNTSQLSMNSTYGGTRIFVHVKKAWRRGRSGRLVPHHYPPPLLRGLFRVLLGWAALPLRAAASGPAVGSAIALPLVTDCWVERREAQVVLLRPIPGVGGDKACAVAVKFLRNPVICLF